MKRSIGKRLFVQIMGTFLVYTALALIANTTLLKPIYNSEKKSGLLEVVSLINSLEGDYENNLTTISEAEEKLSARIIIYDEEAGETIYVTAARMLQGEFVNEEFPGEGQRYNNQDSPSNEMPEDIPEDIPEDLPEDADFRPNSELQNIIGQFVPGDVDHSDYEIIDEDIVISSVTANNDSQYLLLETTLDDGMSILVLSEMQSLNEAVRIFNLFLLGTAAISMIIILFMTYFMSKKFVQPITNMNDVTKKIAKLDFTTKCDVNTKDELQELGESINALSGSLESTIEDLTKELENAKRLEELRKRFVSTVSHELKTPISLIQGYSIGLSSDVCDKKERRDYYAQVIAEESERLGVLVNELMDLTQMEAGYINLHEEDFDLADILDETVEKFQAVNPDIQMSFEKPDGDSWCRADVRYMERVVGNYLSNAVRHVEGDKRISVKMEEVDDYYNVTVRNTGKNIPEDKIDEIWNSFYRVDEARNRLEGGHGLGLSIVKNIQIAHGMPYGVRNVEDGVEFNFGVKKADEPENTI